MYDHQYSLGLKLTSQVRDPGTWNSASQGLEDSIFVECLLVSVRGEEEVCCLEPQLDSDFTLQ